MSKHFIFAIFQLCAFLLTIPAQAQINRSGFISIDCGSSNSSYTDEKTGIRYLSDSNFTESGESNEVLDSYKSKTEEQQLWNLRSFPEGDRNCYTLEPTGDLGTRYLIRARFLYGNYDNKDETPKFDLHVGVDFWDKVEFRSSNDIVSKDIIFVPLSERVHVCLVNTGNGIPFISVLDLRTVASDAYMSPSGTSLLLYGRYDFGSETNQSMRYKDDTYDRFWSTVNTNDWTASTNASFTQDNYSMNSYSVPFTVMKTGYTLNNLDNMGIFWPSLNLSTQYFFFMHFSETMKLRENQTREFNIYLNLGLWFKQFDPVFAECSTIYSPGGYLPDAEAKISVWFNYTTNATLPPLVNALEIYGMQENSGIETYQQDVDAVLSIKTEYGLKIQNWQGDPCVPQDYLWDGLNCTYKGFNPPRITTLDLSSRGLKGEISFSIANLTELEYLDMSNNSLTGIVPEFLAELEDLRILNLKGNNLEGPIPPMLIYRSKNGLVLSVDDNLISNETSPTPTNQPSSSPKFSSVKNNFFIPVVVSFGGFLLHSVLQLNR